MTTISLRGTDVCLPLEAAIDVQNVGGKAYALGRMLRAGIVVPSGIVLTVDAFQAFLAENELDPPARSAQMPAWVREQLLTAAAPLLALGPVVVRSSAVGEDGAGESFAGQLDSVLHIADSASLERAVLDVWASLWSERAIFYRTARGLGQHGMGVVIQRQVEAKAAGVLFTTTTSGEMLVEYAPGLGDALVAGQVDPSRVAIDRQTGAIRVLASYAFNLEANRFDELRSTGFKLETEFGSPQDIEWALSTDDTLFIVQSRPITAPLALNRSTVPPFHRFTAWSNANINENFPRPVSPLLFSIASAGYTHYFRNLAVAFGVSSRRVSAMEPAFRQIIGLHGARMYYNLTSIHSVLRLAPFGDALTASFDTFVGADGDAVNAETVGSSSRLAQIAEVAVILAKATRCFRDIDSRIARFERTIDEFAARTSPERLESMSLAELGRALSDFVEIRRHKWLDASLADAASMICYGALERLLRRAFGSGSVHTSLLKAIPDVVSGEPVMRLWDLSRLVREDPALHEVFASASAIEILQAIRAHTRVRDAFDAYLDDWGFRCSEELMLTSPSFQEAPEPLVDMLRAYARLDAGSPRDALRAQAAERERETRRVMSELSPVHAAALELLLPRTHAAIRYRERARLKQALLYSRCRRIALALGDRLADHGVITERDDVFFFTHEELVDLAIAPRPSHPLIAERKAEHERQSALTPPDAFTLPDGETFSGEAHVPAVETSGRLVGTPACGGKVTGRATVLASVTESDRLARGDILITKQTDPGWGPVFFLISGLVIERGGMLSHGAIIAREFGIPCVVGVKHAMERIVSGSTVTVNGDTGAVDVAD